MANVNANAPASTGFGKSFAAVAAGALSTILIYIVNQLLTSHGGQALPAEIVAAVQTLITTAAVYYVPHDFIGG